MKFFSNDIQINQEDIIESQMSQINKGENKIKVLVELILNKMTILYKIDKDKEKIKLFGDNFVNNNKNNCCLLIEGKRTELCTELILNEKQKENNTLEIQLIEIKPITNMSYMFEQSRVESLPDISSWNTENVTDMNNLFASCGALKTLPDKLEWNTKNVTNMSNLFYFCTQIESLPDIYIWNISKC